MTSRLEQLNTPDGIRHDHFAAALNALAAHVAVIDDRGTLVAVNDAWRRFAAENGAAGHPSLIEGASYIAGADGVADPDADAASAGIRGVLAGEVDEFRFEYPCHSPTELRWFEMRATPLRDGDLHGAVIVHSIITERRVAEQRLAHLAHHDELTGLPNRRRVMEALREAHGSGLLGVLLLDLDHFKAVNDTFGHAAGNDVLCAVADALGIPMRGGSLAGRHGGDEFSVALFDVDQTSLEAAAATVVERVGERLARLACAAGTSVSVGGTLVDPREPLAAALERADQALYAVKDAGRAGARIL